MLHPFHNVLAAAIKGNRNVLLVAPFGVGALTELSAVIAEHSTKRLVEFDLRAPIEVYEVTIAAALDDIENIVVIEEAYLLPSLCQLVDQSKAQLVLVWRPAVELEAALSNRLTLISYSS